jgi:hypothetical protein
MKEQQAAEQLYAQQANSLMIEDQKIASQEKANQLTQLVNLTQGELENAKSRLDRDKFNATEINTVNRLEGELRNRMTQLNTELQNRAYLQNASEANKVAINNAANILDANKWGGDSAQKALLAGITQERNDIAAGYGYGQDYATALSGVLSNIATNQGTIGAQKEGWGLQLEKLNADKAREARIISDEERRQAAAEELQTQTSLLQAADLINKMRKE